MTGYNSGFDKHYEGFHIGSDHWEVWFLYYIYKVFRNFYKCCHKINQKYKNTSYKIFHKLYKHLCIFFQIYHFLKFPVLQESIRFNIITSSSSVVHTFKNIPFNEIRSRNLLHICSFHAIFMLIPTLCYHKRNILGFVSSLKHVHLGDWIWQCYRVDMIKVWLNINSRKQFWYYFVKQTCQIYSNSISKLIISTFSFLLWNYDAPSVRNMNFNFQKYQEWK